VRSSTSPDSSPALANRTKAADYLAGVNDVIQKLNGAREVAEAVELLREVTNRMGADVSVFGSFMPEDESGASYRFLLNCDPAWCSEYEAQASYSEDPWFDHALNHSEPIRGSELEPRSGAQRRVIEVAERFGFRSTVIVPAPSSGGLARMGVLCLGSPREGYFEGEGFLALKMVARSVAMEFHEWWLTRIRDELIARSGFDDSDRRLLSLVATEHSSKEIGRALALSVPAVESRLRRIRARLEVGSRHAACLMAAEYGLIMPPAALRSR
jgi:DNA-binding CsgD family transcriptional regulator